MTRLLRVVLALVLPACWGLGGGRKEVHEEVFLAYREPAMTARNVPMMMVVWEMPDGSRGRILPSAATLPEPHRLQWGARYRVRVETVVNPTWSTSTRRITEVLEQTPRPGEVFWLEGLSAQFLGADLRSFIDGQRFTCVEPRVEAQLEAALTKAKPFRMKLKFGAAPGEPLLALEVEAPAD